MEDNIKAWLKDIELAIAEINSFLPANKNFKDFQKDLRTKRAIERNIEIIGEAFARITKNDSAVRVTNMRQIIDTRNRIIHGYDSVSDEILWGIVMRHLPLLQEEIKALLD